MKKIVVGESVNREELETLLKYPESISVSENGVCVGTYSENNIARIVNGFHEYRISVELDCIENGEEPIQLDFVEYLANKLGYGLSPDDVITVVAF